MINLDKPLCIIPARGGSKRFPRKNIALLAGKPLLTYTIETALKSGIFDQICVSSEDNEILELAKKYKEILPLKRPKEFATDTIQIKDVCKYLLKYFLEKGIKYSEFCVLLPTSPLRNEDDVLSAYKIFTENNADCVMSLIEFDHPPQRAVWIDKNYVKPYFGQKYMKQTQLLDRLYRHDGSVLFYKTTAFLKEETLYIDKIFPYFTPKERSVDIDTPMDLRWTEYLISYYKSH